MIKTNDKIQFNVNGDKIAGEILTYNREDNKDYSNYTPDYVMLDTQFGIRKINLTDIYFENSISITGYDYLDQYYVNGEVKQLDDGNFTITFTFDHGGFEIDRLNEILKPINIFGSIVEKNVKYSLYDDKIILTVIIDDVYSYM